MYSHLTHFTSSIHALLSLTDPKSHGSITSASGAVAQLGARVNGIHEVAGSIPASSTNIPLSYITPEQIKSPDFHPDGLCC